MPNVLRRSTVKRNSARHRRNPVSAVVVDQRESVSRGRGCCAFVVVYCAFAWEDGALRVIDAGGSHRSANDLDGLLAARPSWERTRQEERRPAKEINGVTFLSGLSALRWDRQLQLRRRRTSPKLLRGQTEGSIRHPTESHHDLRLSLAELGCQVNRSASVNNLGRWVLETAANRNDGALHCVQQGHTACGQRLPVGLERAFKEQSKFVVLARRGARGLCLLLYAFYERGRQRDHEQLGLTCRLRRLLPDVRLDSSIPATHLALPDSLLDFLPAHCHHGTQSAHHT
jgi:hypothetical protein